METSGRILLLLAGILFSQVIYHLLWLRFQDPLRHIPGPWYTRISSVWLAAVSRLGRKSVEVHRLHQQYGDVVRISVRHVSINRPEALGEIYTHDRAYPKGPWYSPLRTRLPPLIATYDADEHTEQRKNLQPAFSIRSIREFEPYMSAYHLRFILLLDGLFDGHSETHMDLNKWINLLSFDIISDFAFGKPFGFLEKGYDFMDMVRAMDERLNSTNATGNLPAWLMPYVVYFPDRFWAAGAKQILRIRKLVEASYEERVNSGNAKRKDLLNYMLEAKSEGGEPLPKGRILSNSTAMVVAGSDSTAASTVHFVDKVSRDLELQEKVRAEIDEIFPGKPTVDWVPSDVDTNRLHYTKAVLYEVLRLCPTLSLGLERTVTRPGTFFGNHELPPGTLISVPTYSVQRNSDVFPDPETFDPQRWLQKDASKQYQTFSIFSSGPRSCIGQNFAWMEMMKTIVMLLKLYHIERTRKEPTEYFDGFFLKARECNVKLKKRY